jgi:hypothetical protein
VKVVFPKKKKAAVPKGLAIRLELMAILDTLSVEQRSCAYFIQIDGTGALEYKGIEAVLDTFFQGPEHPEVVLGQRSNDSKDWCMGHPERKAIELFEKFLIEERFRKIVDEEFGGSLPDAQAGCWGLRLDALKTVSLTAGGYELELDIVTSALELLDCGLLRKTKVAFTRELSCGPRTGGGGGSDTFTLNRASTIDKLPFILHKLGYDKSTLKRMLDNFGESTLPQEYVVAVREWITN